MDPNVGADASGNVADGEAPAGDPFMRIPNELRKAILNDLGDRRDIYAISQASPPMGKAALSAHGILEQLLQTELGPDQLRALLPDALAVVMFPNTTGTPSDAGKKAAIRQHLLAWKSSSDLVGRADDADKSAAYAFVDRLAIPFAEDFTALAGTIDNADDQIRLPAWAHRRRTGKARRPAVEIWRYEPEERVRLLRAFCRFELLSRVIRARPGAQLYSLAEQRGLLRVLFHAWEVEEILCVQLYVGDLHTILFETHVVDVLETLSTTSIIARLTDHMRDSRLIRLRRGPFEDSYSDSDSADDDETEWFTKTGLEPDPGTPCARFELAGHAKHAVFVKQTATFGLAFLEHFLRSDARVYSRWIRANGHVLLDGMADPDEAEYLGPFGARDPAAGGVAWLTPRHLDPAQLDGDNAVASPPLTNANLAYGRRAHGDGADAAANTAWGHLDATNPQLREAFRRCGWVFWSDARLRRHVFWNRRLDVFSPGSAPAWLYRPEDNHTVTTNTAAAAAADPDENEDEDEDGPDYFLSRFEIDARMASAIGGAAFLLGLSSAAEVKLLSFLGENRSRRGNVLFREYPFDGLRRERIPLTVWEESVGGADPAVPAGTVEVFRDIFWG
ncbi:hypothetical protein LZ30DRAFT_806150 [Colletotrichum cereale]|nr:hypothetical protein LZ30DRAFT_806150 [Colletotrichum cereale]